MYQVKDINGQKLINGYEIAVCGNICKVRDCNGNEKFVGNWEQCLAYCREHGLVSN